MPIKQSWQQLAIVTKAEHADDIADFVTALGAVAVTLQDAADEAQFQLDPEHTPLWPRTVVVGLFELDNDVPAILARLKQMIPNDAIESEAFEVIEEQDWVRITQQHFKPQSFADKLWVYPSWLEPPEPHDGKTILKLDPGLAFGTGTHPTTSLCLGWLAEHAPEGLRVIDYGCGSGILALASLKLGAADTWATDHDEQALLATEQNAQLNTIDNKQLHIATPETLPAEPADLVLANILANPLVELAPKLTSLVKPGGTLLLSGILAAEESLVKTAYEPSFKFNATQELDGWLLLTGVRV